MLRVKLFKKLLNKIPIPVIDSQLLHEGFFPVNYSQLLHEGSKVVSVFDKLLLTPNLFYNLNWKNFQNPQTRNNNNILFF